MSTTVLPPQLLNDLLANSRKRVVDECDWEDMGRSRSGGPGEVGNVFKRCRPATQQQLTTSSTAATPTPFDNWFRSMNDTRGINNGYAPPCTAQRRDLSQTSNTQRFDPQHCQNQNRKWGNDDRDDVQYTRRHMEMLRNQKDQEIQEVVQKKDHEIACTAGRNQTLMKGVLQLHQQAEHLKNTNLQKDLFLQRAVQRIQELENANLELRQTIHQVTGGMGKCGGGAFDQAPPPPPAVF